jgi:NAD-dependent dihydropyrimidine dehydrogenase PreA subunit
MNAWVLPQIDLDRCTQCGACVSGCTGNALQMGAHGPLFVQPENCTYCTDCEPLCPSGAITCAFEITWDEN